MTNDNNLYLFFMKQGQSDDRSVKILNKWNCLCNNTPYIYDRHAFFSDKKGSFLMLCRSHLQLVKSMNGRRVFINHVIISGWLVAHCFNYVMIKRAKREDRIIDEMQRQTGVSIFVSTVLNGFSFSY